MLFEKSSENLLDFGGILVMTHFWPAKSARFRRKHVRGGDLFLASE